MATTMASLRQQARQRLVETLALIRPAAPLVSQQGTPGASTISYVIVAVNNAGTSDASQATTITNAAATLSGVNFVLLNWQAVPNAASYKIYRTATNGVSPVTVGLIGTSTNPTFSDTGLAGDGAIAPTINTSGVNNPFWTEDELHQHLVNGCRDLWKSIVDLHQGHFVKISDPASGGTMVYPAGVSGLTTNFTGVPTDCFRILMVEPQDLGASGSAATFVRRFRPKQFWSRTFQDARSMTVQDSTAWIEVYYDILNAGAPVGAPLLVGAPPISAAVPIRLTYVNTLPTLIDTDTNPIPGESDNALIAWCVAYAKSKEQDTVNRVPDPGWLAIYATEKQGLLVALTPRQEQEEEIVEGLFNGEMGSNW